MIKKVINVGVLIVGDVELFVCLVVVFVIVVIGLNGKSIVVMLVGKVFEVVGYEVCVVGNIGLLVLDVLLLVEEVDVWVLELFSF